MTYLRRALGGTPVDAPLPLPGKKQSPIYPLEVGAHGAWLEMRNSPADGSCGVHGYPCQHPGVDVAGTQGTMVVAPESGTIVATGDGALAPFVGYGPWFVIILGDGGKYHFLGHLDPTTSSMGPQGATVTAGDPIGTTSSANHTHWELRTNMVPDFASGEDNFSNNSDPIAWLTSEDLLVPLLLIGGALLLVYLVREGA